MSLSLKDHDYLAVDPVELQATEQFSRLLEQILEKIDFHPGSVIHGTVLSINHDRGYAVIDTPLKSEGLVKLDEFLDKDGKLEIAVGDNVPVAVESFEDGSGETRISRTKAKKIEAWAELAQAQEDKTSILALIVGKVKGGFTVDIKGIRAFLPGSLIDIRLMKDQNLEGSELELKVIKLDQKRNNVVVSRRAVIESENTAEKEALLHSLQEGSIVQGVVKNLTDYGAFVDLGGIDGLLHITDITWKRVKHPQDVLTIGQNLTVKVLKFDKDKMRVSLGLKQLGEDPWVGMANRYPEGKRVNGVVTNIADYGCFVELEEGIEGLVHVSEMDWTNRNIHPSKVVELGENVEVMILEIDEERRRISLGLKQCKSSPWHAFAAQRQKGDKIKGRIRSITDFGIFVGLEGSIDGLVHLSDISWHKAGEEAVKDYKRGQEIEAIVLAVDAERERISLGIKQLENDPFNQFCVDYAKGSIVTGVVKEVDARGATLELAPEVLGYLKAQDISRDKINDARDVLSVDQTVEAKITNIDRKNRQVALSIRAKESQEEAAVLRDYTRQDGAGNSTLGDLLKEQFKDKN
ncbi:30S ribosomal protein S1 [bacterium]|nr:30S ribosomal protein S1 [bacterium]NBX72074.1 30S ribosomal protein S1 [bacterium]